MRIDSIKRWQWMVLGLVVGLLWGLAHRLQAGDLASYGEGINDQALFERRVLGSAGVPLFKEIRVTRQKLDDGSGNTQTLYIVSGKSAPENARAGEPYRAMWFAAHVPYRPALDIAKRALKNPDALARWQRISRPTVLDWLRLEHEIAGVSYTNVWWDTYPVWTYTTGGLIAIGLLWPFFINLHYFHRLFRPREEKALSLLGVHAPASDGDGEKPQFDLAHLHALEAELESSIRASVPAAASEAPSPATRTLQTDVAPITPNEPREDRHFRAKPDDYYPTEERVHPPQ